jgi:hypothetical protein
MRLCGALLDADGDGVWRVLWAALSHPDAAATWADTRRRALVGIPDLRPRNHRPHGRSTLHDFGGHGGSDGGGHGDGPLHSVNQPQSTPIAADSARRVRVEAAANGLPCPNLILPMRPLLPGTHGAPRTSTTAKAVAADDRADGALLELLSIASCR